MSPRYFNFKIVQTPLFFFSQWSEVIEKGRIFYTFSRICYQVRLQVYKYNKWRAIVSDVKDIIYADVFWTIFLIYAMLVCKICTTSELYIMRYIRQAWLKQWQLSLRRRSCILRTCPGSKTNVNHSPSIAYIPKEVVDSGHE